MTLSAESRSVTSTDKSLASDKRIRPSAADKDSWFRLCWKVFATFDEQQKDSEVSAKASGDEAAAFGNVALCVPQLLSFLSLFAICCPKGNSVKQRLHKLLFNCQRPNPEMVKAMANYLKNWEISLMEMNAKEEHASYLFGRRIVGAEDEAKTYDLETFEVLQMLAIEVKLVHKKNPVTTVDENTQMRAVQTQEQELRKWVNTRLLHAYSREHGTDLYNFTDIKAEPCRDKKNRTPGSGPQVMLAGMSWTGIQFDPSYDSTTSPMIFHSSKKNSFTTTAIKLAGKFRAIVETNTNKWVAVELRTTPMPLRMAVVNSSVIETKEESGYVNLREAMTRLFANPIDPKNTPTTSVGATTGGAWKVDEQRFTHVIFPHFRIGPTKAADMTDALRDSCQLSSLFERDMIGDLVRSEGLLRGVQLWDSFEYRNDFTSAAQQSDKVVDRKTAGLHQIVLDKPFYLVIWDNNANLPVLLCAVRQPQQRTAWYLDEDGSVRDNKSPTVVKGNRFRRFCRFMRLPWVRPPAVLPK